jgi:hypothetical protein
VRSVTLVVGETSIKRNELQGIPRGGHVKVLRANNYTQKITRFISVHVLISINFWLSQKADGGNRMSEKKFKVMQKQSAKKFTVKVTESEVKPRVEAAGSNYLVALINSTDICIIMGRVNQGHWFPTPKVCRTCSSDYDTCFNQQAWAPVLNCQCNEAPFELTLVEQPDANGNAKGGTWTITPDCGHAGGVIGLQ